VERCQDITAVGVRAAKNFPASSDSIPCFHLFSTPRTCTQYCKHAIDSKPYIFSCTILTTVGQCGSFV